MQRCRTLDCQAGEEPFKAPENVGVLLFTVRVIWLSAPLATNEDVANTIDAGFRARTFPVKVFLNGVDQLGKSTIRSTYTYTSGAVRFANIPLRDTMTTYCGRVKISGGTGREAGGSESTRQR